MPQVDVFDLEKKKVGTVDLASNVFECPVNDSVLHLVVKWQLASKRSGSASTKTRDQHPQG